MIPEEKSEAVTRAVQEAFQTPRYDDVRLLNKSRSAMVFRIAVKGRFYLLRIIDRISDSGCECQFIAMRAAADAGFAPRVWYTSLVDRICLTDFVESIALSQKKALLQLPILLKTLHQLPSFPGREDHLNTSCTFLLGGEQDVARLIEPFRGAKLLPENEMQQLFKWYAQILEVYPRRDAEMVSSHNDLVRPGNILFDGKQVWLIDWEAAFLNDRYAELAVVANFVATSPDEEMAFLQAYFDRSPDQYELARFFLMQQLAHIFYALVYLLLGSKGAAVNWQEEVPSFYEFHRRVWTGETDMEDSQSKITYGKVHWYRLAGNALRPQFAEALRSVASGR